MTSNRHVVAASSDQTSASRRRHQLVMWRRPIKTLYYSLCETCVCANKFVQSLTRIQLCLLVAMATLLTALVHCSPAFHRLCIFSCYWLGLGVLSSVGLGTGLHTFLLYLGPHIAAVTLAAQECHSVDFPQPPYPDQIVCPDVAASAQHLNVGIWRIMSKVRFEAILWGVGTALGELPPYFMARAARLSGSSTSEPGVSVPNGGCEPTLMDRVKSQLELIVHRTGFVGILACASVPNPLFDLAGITCGHFLVPFWTFFGATLVGKAVIKVHIQQLFVIITFNEALVDWSVRLMRNIPVVGVYIQKPFRDLLSNQKRSLHRRPASNQSDWSTNTQLGGGNLLSFAFEKLVLGMVVYFVISIVNSLAQRYSERRDQKTL